MRSASCAFSLSASCEAPTSNACASYAQAWPLNGKHQEDVIAWHEMMSSVKTCYKAPPYEGILQLWRALFDAQCSPRARMGHQSSI